MNARLTSAPLRSGRWFAKAHPYSTGARFPIGPAFTKAQANLSAAALAGRAFNCSISVAVTGPKSLSKSSFLRMSAVIW